ncbi:MAG TPA: RNA polymerase sigma factor [Planctomycetota bacterium]|nr:RNA polymerase sigma factor [Planctomycetota bacterium]
MTIGIPYDALVERIRDGDSAAWEDLLRLTLRQVRAVIAFHIDDPASLDDLAQETYLYLAQHLDDYRVGSDFGAWLRTIARNRALDLRRSRQRRAEVHGRYLTALRARLGDGAERRVTVDAHLAEALQRCLARLSAPIRDLVVRRYVEEEPVRAIAGSIGRSPNGIAVALHRARAALLACMRGHEAKP